MARKPKLLAGGNPQIPKGDGDGPVQAYIEAMPEWKSEVGRRIDAVVARVVPDARKAVKWNNPLYGADEESWFLSFRCFSGYVKVAFFQGTALDPLPPVGSKSGEVRYLHVEADDELDDEQLADWIRQASELPGVAL